MRVANQFGRKLGQAGVLSLLLLLATACTRSMAADRSGNRAGIEPSEDRPIRMDRTLDDKVAALEKELEHTKEEMSQKLDYQMKCNEAALNSVSTNLAGASHALTTFAIIVGVFGAIVAFAAVALGIYIGRQVRNVSKLAAESRTAHRVSLELRDEVRQLDDRIRNNMRDLYAALRTEETKALAERLVQVPEDIGNVFCLLASRELPSDLFTPLKKAYQSLQKQTPLSVDPGLYLTLFFQHFAASALFDDDLAPEIERAYGRVMGDAFKNDIIRSSREFINVCTRSDILTCKEKIRKFFTAVYDSPHAKYSELHGEIYTALRTKENRFALYSILAPEDEIKEIRAIYGRFMLADYKGASGNTESEQLVLKQIEEEVEAPGEQEK